MVVCCLPIFWPGTVMSWSLLLVAWERDGDNTLETRHCRCCLHQGRWQRQGETGQLQFSSAHFFFYLLMLAELMMFAL